MTENQYQAD